jgi:hypothetical protein
MDGTHVNGWRSMNRQRGMNGWSTGETRMKEKQKDITSNTWSACFYTAYNTEDKKKTTELRLTVKK